jgi:hypothetical protein
MASPRRSLDRPAQRIYPVDGRKYEQMLCTQPCRYIPVFVRHALQYLLHGSQRKLPLVCWSMRATVVSVIRA